MLALAIPWFLVLLIVAAVVCLIKKKWKLTLLLAGIVLVVDWWGECIPFRLLTTQGTGKGTKVISFNIDGSTGDTLEKARNVRDFLLDYSPDIVFLAEFNEQYPHCLDSLLSKEFKYSTYPDSLFFQYFYGKYPFFNSRRMKSGDGKWIGVYACSTIINGDTLDLYGCHWASNNYNEFQEREGMENIDGIKNIGNIQTAGVLRKIEAEAIVREMSLSSHPAIILGDMNEVGGTKAIKTLEAAGLKDAWWEKGVGYGATIRRPLPYRIDHIIYTPSLRLETIQVLDSKGISDHDALYAEFEF